MIILPSIDLMSGACVRLKQGDFAQQTTYGVTPVEMANHFKTEGATALHIVDLQGAKNGQLTQIDEIAAIVKAFGPGVQVGGGVRTRADVDTLISLGVQRVVIGTRAVSYLDEIQSWIEVYGTAQLVFALDVRWKDKVPYVATCGWQSDSQHTLWRILDILPAGSHVLCTDIGQDGMSLGPNLAMYQTCVERYPNLYFQASGGVSQLLDVKALQSINVSACIIGRALYEKTFRVAEAITCLNDA